MRARLVASLCGITLVLTLAACPATRTRGGTIEKRERPVRGGTLNVSLAEDVDFLDPQRAGQPASFALLRALHRGLMAFPPRTGDRGSDPVPDLAAGEPEVSADGRAYTFRLREGAAFGPPASRPLVAADVRAGLERALAPQVPSPLATYFTVIEGAAAFASGRATSVSGIATPDERTVVIRLTRPYNDLLWMLALPAASAVPSEIARAARPAPSAIAPSGPYRLAPADGYVPETSIHLVRNPAWSAEVDPVRPAWVDEIVVAVGAAPSRIDRALLDNTTDLSLDAPPAAATAALARDRLYEVPGACLRYLWMNTTVKPFTDVRVRRAVATALAAGVAGSGERPRSVLVRTLAGSPGGTPPSSPSARAADARAMLARAGFPTGFPTRLVVGDRPEDLAQAREAATALRAAGVRAAVSTMPIASLYVDGYEVPSRRIPMGLATWCADWPGRGGRAFLTPLLGTRFPSRGNQNYAMLSSTALARLLDAAAVAPADGVEAAWGLAAAEVERLAPWVPLLDLNEVSVVSSRVGGFVAPPMLARGDLTALWLRASGAVPQVTTQTPPGAPSPTPSAPSL